jgi:hypothetical protein
LIVQFNTLVSIHTIADFFTIKQKEKQLLKNYEKIYVADFFLLTTSICPNDNDTVIKRKAL